MKKFSLLALGCGLLFGLCTWLVVRAPNEFTMGLIQRIFYIHVPCAMLFFTMAFVAGGAGMVLLVRRSMAAEPWMKTALELGILFGLCVLVTGPLWGRKAWGHWWVWDARLTTSLILWLTLVMARFAHAYGGPGGAQLAAGLSIFGSINVPFVYFSVSWWRSIHPEPDVVRTLDPAMRPAFWGMTATMALLCTLLFVLRLRMARLEQTIEEHTVEEELE